MLPLASLLIWLALLPAEGLGVYWLVDVLVDEDTVEDKGKVEVKDMSEEEEEERARGFAGSVV